MARIAHPVRHHHHAKRHDRYPRLDAANQAMLHVVIALALLFPIIWVWLGVFLDSLTFAALLIGTGYASLLASMPR